MKEFSHEAPWSRGQTSGIGCGIVATEPSELSLSREFVREKKYQTEAEAFGWSFVFEDFVSPELRKQENLMPVREPGHGGVGGVGAG